MDFIGINFDPDRNEGIRGREVILLTARFKSGCNDHAYK